LHPVDDQQEPEDHRITDEIPVEDFGKTAELASQAPPLHISATKATPSSKDIAETNSSERDRTDADVLTKTGSSDADASIDNAEIAVEDEANFPRIPDNSASTAKSADTDEPNELPVRDVEKELSTQTALTGADIGSKSTVESETGIMEHQHDHTTLPDNIEQKTEEREDGKSSKLHS
jgi:hypothetical protein